jgi:sterol desaturase/sphingolipid hydroxylase (fatty acid hydroxylase superfamily)
MIGTMRVEISDGLVRLAKAIHLRELAGSMANAALVIGGLFVVIYILEAASGQDRARYRSRHFLNDLVYVLFYQGGFYTLFIWAAIANVMGSRLSFLKIEVLAGLPGPVHWLVYWIVLDFIAYWVHRLEHRSEFLWAFHSVHHSQEQMTFVTTWRNHPIEQVFANVITFVPLLILGVPTGVWFPLVAVQYAFEAVQHSQLDWRYGRLYRIFVSPTFHAFHHSTDPRHHHGNYAKILSLWDYLFGTAIRDEPRPVATGVTGLSMAESIGSQMTTPFRLLFGRSDRIGRPRAAPR